MMPGMRILLRLSRADSVRVVTRHVAAARCATAVAIAALVVTAAQAPAASVTRLDTRSARSLPYVRWRLEFQARLPEANGLYTVEVSGKSDAWAAGSAARPGPRGYAVHWNGSTWKRRGFPDSSFVPTAVRASSARNVWFLGQSSSTKEVLRWDGARWHVIAIPQFGTGVGLPVVLGRANAWLPGSSGVTGSRSTVLWHWNGTSWKSYALPAFSGAMNIAGTSDRNLWAAGLTGVGAAGVGRLALYRWNGRAWKPSRAPRVYLSGAPALAMSASGEAWIAGYGTKAVGHESVIYYRTAGRWHRLPDRLLPIDPPQVDYPPMPDGRNGIWFGFTLYWNGKSAEYNSPHIPPGCARPPTENADPAVMAGIPGSHVVLWATSCPRTLRGKTQGTVLASKP